ncbi:protamine [Schistocerca gregaria]|uniref:protamine n=1 Tax=Schistocerca gregaria TaxID=7010 RepID=UPI00211EA1F9|nr:protamine [Schistocerca gregaria]
MARRCGRRRRRSCRPRRRKGGHGRMTVSAFFNFLRALKRKYPCCPRNELICMASRRWRRMTCNQKERYQAMARRVRCRTPKRCFRRRPRSCSLAARRHRSRSGRR